MNHIIGIDLGTTNSCVAVFKDEQIHIIQNEDGDRTTPSCVYFKGNERIIGKLALGNIKNDPSNVIYGVKRLIGRKMDDYNVLRDTNFFQYKIESDNTKENKPIIYVPNTQQKYYPEEISSFILSKLKKIAQDYLNNDVKDCVITVPAYFTDSQRQATKDSGKIAGLNVLRIINEPTAAALAYGLNKKCINKHILVFDLGGGTFDTTILKLTDGIFDVKATGGDTHLGGEDFDNNLIKYCFAEFIKKNKNNLNVNDIKYILESQKIQQKIRVACVCAKKELSNSIDTTIYIESLYEEYDLNLKLSRNKFNFICKKEFDKCMDSVKNVLNDANLTPSDIDHVVLVGGSTRIIKIHEMIKSYFGDKLCKDINPDEAVAYGAAIQGEILAENSSNIVNDIVLMDITPLSIGIETADGSFDRLIKKNSYIPQKATKCFSTFSDNQPGVTIKIYEGEREIAKKNNLLGIFELVGLTKAKRGIPLIEVICQINTDGIITVSATEKIKDKSSGDTNFKKITIKNNKGRLTEKQIKEKIKDALIFEEEDKKYQENMRAKYSFENFLLEQQTKFDNFEMREKLDENIIEQIFARLISETRWLNDHHGENKLMYYNKEKKLKEDFSKYGHLLHD